LFDEFDKNYLIVILLELKLFLGELITYYKTNSSENSEVTYELKLYHDTNVIGK